jgi:hypothetical protein
MQDGPHVDVEVRLAVPRECLGDREFEHEAGERQVVTASPELEDFDDVVALPIKD